VIIACAASGCVRGLVHRAGGWADPCKFCGGLGGITMAELCRRIDEYESTVIGLFKPERRMRSKTAFRILNKLLEVSK
jgi:hypothetical protein